MAVSCDIEAQRGQNQILYQRAVHLLVDLDRRLLLSLNRRRQLPNALNGLRHCDGSINGVQNQIVQVFHGGRKTDILI